MFRHDTFYHSNPLQIMHDSYCCRLIYGKGANLLPIYYKVVTKIPGSVPVVFIGRNSFYCRVVQMMYEYLYKVLDVNYFKIYVNTVLNIVG